MAERATGSPSILSSLALSFAFGTKGFGANRPPKAPQSIKALAAASLILPFAWIVEAFVPYPGTGWFIPIFFGTFTMMAIIRLVLVRLYPGFADKAIPRFSRWESILMLSSAAGGDIVLSVPGPLNSYASLFAFLLVGLIGYLLTGAPTKAGSFGGTAKGFASSHHRN